MADRHEALLLERNDEWAKPEHSKKAVRRAGELLAEETLDVRQIEDGLNEIQARLSQSFTRDLSAEFEARHSRYRRWLNAHAVLDNWRSSHLYPQAVMYVKLAICSRKIDESIFTASRLKRLPSIIAKLRRFEHMSLAGMQDLGGCRAVVGDLSMVAELQRALAAAAGLSELQSFDDYITAPKDDGYRGIHLIYRFVSSVDKMTVYDGMRVEIQLRTKVQHAWATAVETIDLFHRQAIKAGGGDDRWRRFFKLASEAFAAYELARQQVVEAVIPSELREEMAELVGELDVFSRLEGYRDAVRMVLEESGPSTFLLKLDLERNELNIVGYRESEQEKAQSDYAEAERAMTRDDDIVLVSATGVQGLREAYPNYFADTRLFLEALRDTLGWVSYDPVPEWLFDDLRREEGDEKL